MLITKNIFNSIGLIVLTFFLLTISCSTEKNISDKELAGSNNKYINLSIDLISSIKEKKNIIEIQHKLAQLHEDSLASFLKTDNQKKAFWINIYNAHIQILLTNNPELFENRNSFFGKKQISIAGRILSFDDIEHGIIRSSKFKLALGLIKNPFAGEFEKKFRTNKTDGRVHFALNCGAKSCPEVAIYDAKDFDNSINKVAKHFLQKECKFDKKENKVYVTSLFSWFRGDFGGKRGTIELLQTFKIIPEDTKPSISYNDYDWTLSLGNYYE
jgi:hypothetical protein